MSPRFPSSTSDSPPPANVVRMRSPGEIVSAVPYLLGFVPQDSVVVIGLRGKRLGLTCRLDLSDVAEEQATAAITRALERDEVTSVILAAYGADRSGTAPALEHVRNRLAEVGIDIREEVSVIDGRWFHETCVDARCCPPDGTAVVDHDEAPSTLALSAATGGYLATRAQVVARCSPDRPLLVAAIRAELECLERGTGLEEPCEEAIVDDVLAILGWGEAASPSPGQLARAAYLTTVPSMRDVWYAVVAPGMMRDHRPDLVEIHQQVVAAGRQRGDLDAAGILVDGEARTRVLDRLLEWVRNLPDDCPEVTMGPLVVAGMAHWCAGDGAYARVLTERAWGLQTQPLGMLRTLSALIEHGIREEHLGWLAADFAASRARRPRMERQRRMGRRGRRRRGGPTRAA